MRHGMHWCSLVVGVRIAEIVLNSIRYYRGGGKSPVSIVEQLYQCYRHISDIDEMRHIFVYHDDTYRVADFIQNIDHDCAP